MSQENVEIVREAFESFLGGDEEKTAQLLDPEVEFHGTVGGLQEGQIAHVSPRSTRRSSQRIWKRGKSAAWSQRSSSTLATTS
jgi:ketosteroid isomerase-like protein